MIAKALFFLLLALSILFLLRALRRREGLVQFPALFAGTFLFSIVPQCVNHVFYPGRLPTRVYQDFGVEFGLLMCILCLVAGILGYRGEPMTAARRERLMPRIDVDRLFWAGTALCLIGVYGDWRLTALAGGWRAQYTEGAHYALEWTGAPVFWAYVGMLLPLGLILCFNSTLNRSRSSKWGFCFLMALYPLANIIFLGRRGVTFHLTLIVLTSLWFQRRWVPPRWLSVTGMALGGMLIILMPYYRSYASQTGDLKGAIFNTDVESALQAYATGDMGEGMDNLIMGIPARLTRASYFWGTGFWNTVVAYWVPGQIVGPNLKEGLKIQLGEDDDDVFDRYCGSERAYGGYSTGPYSAFCEFWFLGCVLYFVIGRMYRWLWYFAENRRDLGTQVIYVSCALLTPVAVVNSVTIAFAQLLLPVGVLFTIFWVLSDRRLTLISEEPRSVGRRTCDAASGWGYSHE